MRRAAAACVALALAGAAHAQDAIRNEIALSIAAPTGAVATASYTPMFALLGGRLGVGVGARFSAYHDGGRVDYPNGDAALLDAGARNVLSVPSPRTYAVNFALQATVRLAGRVELGANIDLAGLGFGPERTGAYAGSDPALAGVVLLVPRSLATRAPVTR